MCAHGAYYTKPLTRGRRGISRRWRRPGNMFGSLGYRGTKSRERSIQQAIVPSQVAKGDNRQYSTVHPHEQKSPPGLGSFSSYVTKPELCLHVGHLVGPSEVVHKVHAQVSHDAAAGPQVNVAEPHGRRVRAPSLAHMFLSNTDARGIWPGVRRQDKPSEDSARPVLLNTHEKGSFECVKAARMGGGEGRGEE